MGLNKYNYDKLDVNCLYKMKDKKETERIKEIRYDPFWCRNWTFVVKKHDDGSADMLDTYFTSYDSGAYSVTDENINDFEVIFNFNDMNRITEKESNDYFDEEVIRVGVDSGGRFSKNNCFVRKDLEKSKLKLILNARKEVERCKYSLKWAEDNLKRLLDS